MKKLTGFAVILWLLLGAWSGAGWYLLRGAGAYRLPTTLGKVFAASWQYTLLAAVLLAVILLAALVVKIRRKKNAPLQVAAAGETGEVPAEEVPAEEKRGLKRVRFGAKKAKKAAEVPAAAKIAPAAAAETELMDTGETVLMDTEEKIAPAQGTVLMDAEEKIAPAQGTVLMDAEEKIAPAQGTVLMGAEEKIPPAGPVKGCCAVCGAVLKDGARFCVECGAKVIGGGV